MRILSLLVFSLLLGACGETANISVVPNGVGVEACSHTLIDLPQIDYEAARSGAVGPAAISETPLTFVNFEFSINYDVVNETIGLVKDDEYNNLQVIATLYMKDGTPVDYPGNIRYSYKDGIFPQSNNTFEDIVGDKEAFTDAFGAYPKISCRIVGM